MTDAIEALARAKLVEMYIDLSVQLERGTGTRPVLWLLVQQRDKAIDAMVKMIEVDASEQIAIRALQNEVRLYSDLMESARALLIRGAEADREMTEADRAEIAQFLTTKEAREMGLPEQTED